MVQGVGAGTDMEAEFKLTRLAIPVIDVACQFNRNGSRRTPGAIISKAILKLGRTFCAAAIHRDAPSHSVVGNLREILNSRFSLTQIITHNSGQHECRLRQVTLFP